MIASSARKSSACNAPVIPRGGELHLWLCRRDAASGTDGFLRDVLSRYTGVARPQLRIVRGAHGKPALAAPPAPLDFNLSDSGDWLALAVSNGTPVGIDLEYCDPGRDVLKLARRCFSARELADLQACTGALRIQRFYDYWTLKEAHVKAAGGSLARELESTAFALGFPAAHGDPVGSIAPLVPATAGSARYWLLQPLPDYRLALCCREAAGGIPRLHLYELGADGLALERAPALRAVSVAPGDIPRVASL